MKLTIAITGVEKIRGLEDASKKIIKDSLEKQARYLLYKAWRRRERVDPDPVAVNSYNPKEYAGEADAIKDGQAYSGILVGADKGVFSQAQPDRASAAKWLDDGDTMQFRYTGDVYIGVAKGWTGKAKTETPAPIRFASITPRYPGEDTKRAPIENDLHVCKIERNWLTWSTALRFLGDWRFSDNITVIEYCPHCGGLLPTLQLHEGNAE